MHANAGITFDLAAIRMAVIQPNCGFHRKSSGYFGSSGCIVRHAGCFWMGT